MFIADSFSCLARSLRYPSPLWGGVRGGGRCWWTLREQQQRPPSPTLPHKGGGSAPSSRLGRTSSNPLSVEHRPLAGAVALQRALLTDRVRALEDPVLPGGEAREDFRFHRLRPAEAQIGLEAGEAVGREARALLQEHAHLVLPVDVVAGKRNEPHLLRGLGIERTPDLGLRDFDQRRIGKKAARKPRQGVRHRIGAE